MAELSAKQIRNWPVGKSANVMAAVSFVILRLGGSIPHPVSIFSL
jgi:hypothetical protein